MSTYCLECQMFVQRDLNEVFAFFERPANLARITPSWLSFQVVSTGEIEMKKDATIDYYIRWMGLRLFWRTFIEQYDPPRSFIDVQAKGPYYAWRHQHVFEETCVGVKVIDRVDYALPFGMFGTIAHALVVKRQLLAIFRYRQRALADVFCGKVTQVVTPTITRTG